MDVEQIFDCINRGEDSCHQFKENFTNVNSLAAEMVAFANSRGGHLFIGITDKGDIIGLSRNDIDRINQLISNAASQNVRSAINPETENIRINDKLVMVVTIHEGTAKPYTDNQGIIWIKSGADKRKVTSREELRRLFQDSDLIYADEIPIEGTSVNDLDMDYFADFFRNHYEEELDQTNVPLDQLLENMNLAKKKQLNLAGLLLFGKKPQWKKTVFVIKAVSFIGNDRTGNEYRDSEDIGGNLKVMYKDTMSFLKKKPTENSGKSKF